MKVYCIVSQIALEVTTDIFRRCSPEYKAAPGALYVYAVSPDMYKEKPCYVGVADSDIYLDNLVCFPDIGILVLTPIAAEYVGNRLNNRVYSFWEPHCNYEKQIRPKDREVRVVGYAGKMHGLKISSQTLEEKLKENGLKLKTLWVDGDTSRKELVDFYSQVDIAIAFRTPPHPQHHPPEMKGIVKMISPGSFKIPFVSFPDCVYRRLDLDCYLPARSPAELVKQCVRLKNSKDLYTEYAERVHAFSADKHIDKCAKQYDRLIS